MSRTDETNGTDGTDEANGRALFEARKRIERARNTLLVVQSMLAVIANTSEAIELDDEFRAIANHLDDLMRGAMDELELAERDARAV